MVETIGLSKRPDINTVLALYHELGKLRMQRKRTASSGEIEHIGKRLSIPWSDATIGLHKEQSEIGTVRSPLSNPNIDL